MGQKFCLFWISFLFMIGFVSAVECGSDPIDGCTVTNDSVFNEGIYYFPSGISIGANDVTLDCNGATLIGEGSGNGIYNRESDRVTIKNCNVKNYSNGIYFYYRYTGSSYSITGYTPDSNILLDNVLEDNDVGLTVLGFRHPYQSKNHNISNNVFRNNNKGIDFRETISSSISWNVFENNLEEGVNLQTEVNDIDIFWNSFVNNLNDGISIGDVWDSLVYGNMFNGTGISYVATNGNEYCLDGEIGNEYVNGAVGPPCSCLPLVNGLRVTSSEDFCDGIYNLSSGIVVGAHNIVLDCNGATLVGEDSGNGIYNSHFDNIEIRNCSIKNYANGIYLHSLFTYWGFAPNYNVLRDNTLEDNGVGLKSFGRDYSRYPSLDNSSKHDISYNIFRGNSKGMDFRQTVDSNISHNVFENNLEEGLNLQDEVWGNRIFGNRFLLNNMSAYSLEVNSWNDSEGGNYWDDYDSEEEGCFDSDMNFVCDGPYNISRLSGNADYLPMLEKSCDGKIAVYVSDSDGNLMEGVYAYLDGGSGNVSDVDGFVGFDVSGDCNAMQNVEVRCSDETTICDSKETLLSYSGDVDSMSFVCDMCRSGNDIFVNEDELVFEKVGEMIQVNVLVHSVGMSEDVEVNLIKSCDGVKSQLPTLSVSVSSGESEVVSFLDEFDRCQKIDIVVEYFEEEDFFANNMIKDFTIIDPLNVYLEIDVGYSSVGDVIGDYIGDFVRVVSKEDADLEIYVGKKLYRTASVGVNYLDKEMIRFEGKREGLPYNGLIQQGVFAVGPRLYVFGNEIDGSVAAVRRLMEERERYLNKRTLGEDMGDVYLAGDDIDAVSVFDYLHSDENVRVYRKDDPRFADVVDSVLRKRILNLEIKRVFTTNDETSLRMKHISSDYSDEFKDVVNSEGRPIVMAGGLFSDLTMWEGGGDGLAVELAEDGYDVWEIEITGGPNSDCENCPDYSYEDLVDYYWPALIAGVQYYSGVVSLDYVGFSNGCRVALSSLESYQENGKANAGIVDGVMVDLEGSDSNRVVDSFVGIGCPGAFEGESYLIEQVRKHPDSVEEFREKGLEHVNRDDIAHKIIHIGLPGTTKRISLNLWEYYNDAILLNTDSQPGNFNIDRSKIIYGWGGLFNEFGDDSDERDDGIVTEEDAQQISSNINSGNLNKLNIYQESHSGLPSNNQVKKDIRRFLENGY
ncbi:right-handed parallel beta-helix repeat-containing protein [Candidatus Pacearchaeota archaeon]|nr:right-handed parallel beta-helix repeat-containing protein [Candidatus Pacearchaeota archaeon]